MSAVCSRCHAPILWATTTANKHMPLDPKPDPTGIVEAIETSPRLIIRIRRPNEQTPNTTYTAHFATCVKRGSVKKPKPQLSLFSEENDQ